MKICYTDGTTLPLGDGEIMLKRVLTRGKTHVRIYRKKDADGRQYLCIMTGIDEPEGYRQSVTLWFREYARAVLTEKVRQYASQMNVQPARIAIKEQKTRWGSCSSKNNLNFNWKLVLMPERIQDYVVVHELAHLKQMNHSKAFWAEVAKVLPDYEKRRQELRECEAEYAKY